MLPDESRRIQLKLPIFYQNFAFDAKILLLFTKMGLLVLLLIVLSILLLNFWANAVQKQLNSLNCDKM